MTGASAAKAPRKQAEGDKSDTSAKSVALQKTEDFCGFAGPKATHWPNFRESEIRFKCWKLSCALARTTLFLDSTMPPSCLIRGVVGQRNLPDGRFCWIRPDRQRTSAT
jgi:hypothetical protein